MQVILMRHAKAADRSVEHYPDDRTRPLTGAGKKEHTQLCAVLARMGIAADHIVTSPLVRARETAEIAAKALAFTGEIREADELGEECTIGGVVSMLQAYDSAATVLCVGHEPDMSTLGAAFLSHYGDVHMQFKKSAVLGITFPGRPAVGAGSLLYFFRPKLLLQLT